MTEPTSALNKSDAVRNPYRRMYEYYVRIPERFYSQTHLEIIRWLLERQEPAHTVGIPVVRISCDTFSETYNHLFLGPSAAEDHPDFAPLASATERDCAGLAAYPGLLPQGMWMPTNSTGDLSRDDPWVMSFPDVPKPSVLFPMIEPATAPIADWISQTWALAPSSPGSQRWEVHCAGLAVADKQKEPDPSSIQMNIRRGVELTAATDRFFGANEIFNLGSDKAAAFLLAFRLSRLPETGEEGTLFHCLDNSAGANTYRLAATSDGGLRFQVGAGSSVAGTAEIDAGLRPGQWACALAVIKPGFGTEARIELHLAGFETAKDDGFGWTMAGDDFTFTLGGPSDDSALAHHAYLAAWMGPQALGLGDGLLERFWVALNAAYGLGFETKAESGHETEQACWPVGGAPKVKLPELPDPGILAAKYNRDQFPYAALGRLHDGAGSVVDVRGFGCNRRVENHARATEDIADDSVWTVTGGEVVEPAEPEDGVSPEGLSGATCFDWSNGEGEVRADFTVDPAVTSYVAVSCWVRTVGTNPDRCRLFLRNGTEDLPAVQATAVEYGIDARWKRVVTVFDVSSLTEETDLEAGIRRVGGTADEWALWGFQFLKEPVLSPYAPNHGTDTATAPATVLRFEETDFEGFRDRGFVSLRVKLEELAHLWDEDHEAVLVGGYNPDEVEQRVELRLKRNGVGDAPNLLSLTITTKDWSDEVTLPVDWSDTSVEHHLAIAWDLVRPVAGTDRHLGLWVDGALAGDYDNDRPADPMDLSLLITDLRIGCDRDGENQPCAVIREVELLTRHHPGLFTPTRLEERERAEGAEV